MGLPLIMQKIRSRKCTGLTRFGIIVQGSPRIGTYIPGAFRGTPPPERCNLSAPIHLTLDCNHVLSMCKFQRCMLKLTM